MKKINFNLFNRFILWLKKIFRIRPKANEVTRPPGKKSVKVTPAKEKPEEVSPAEEKPVEVPLSEEKTIEVTPLLGERPPEVPSEKKPVEAKPPEEKTPEVPPEKETLLKPRLETSEVELKIEHLEEEAKTKTRKPYKKKAPTEERKEERGKPPEKEKMPAAPKKREKIDLGSTKRKKLRPARQPQQLAEASIERSDKTSEEKEALRRVVSPFVEIDLDNAKVFLILPQQRFKSDVVGQLSYELELDGKKKKAEAKIISNNQGIAKVEEKRIELEEPLVSFQIVFPDELQGKTYIYNHNNENLYAFVAIGNNRGRMCYLYGKEGDINPLPQRYIWALLNEDFELKIEPDVIEERWIWEKYSPFLVNLKETDELVIRNTKTGEEKGFSCEAAFSIEGEQLTDDDFKELMPLFIGEKLKIKAPRESPSGWSVWIQNKVAGYSVVAENWNGVEPLSLKLPHDLPCECGEFQIDICERDERIPIETLFFRWLPFIELNYPRELIIPNQPQGHKSELIKVKVSGVEWVLNCGVAKKVEFIEGNYYQIELPPEDDMVRFSITKKGKPETDTKFQITIPRLRWRTSKQHTWGDKFQKIERKDLGPGEPFYLLIQTNDFDNKYELLGILETNGQKLQEGKFIRKGMEYNLELNQFYDTIRQNKDELSLKVEIQMEKHNHLISEVYILKFALPIIRCKHIACNFETYCREEMVSHFEKYHLHNLIEHLSYEEVREYDKSLPHKIYKCDYCNFYSREDDPQTPTSAICWHIENECSKVDHGKGPPQICFRVVDDIDEIRQNVFPGLLHIYKCKLCGVHFKYYSNKAKVEHFFQKHENEILEYSER